MATCAGLCGSGRRGVGSLAIRGERWMTERNSDAPTVRGRLRGWERLEILGIRLVIAGSGQQGGFFGPCHAKGFMSLPVEEPLGEERAGSAG